jgi:uncharacterized protein
MNNKDIFYSKLPDNDKIEQVACDEMQQDWNDLRFQSVYKDGFTDGAKWALREAKKIYDKHSV